MYTEYIRGERTDSMSRIVEFVKKHKKLTIISASGIIVLILILRVFSGIRSVTIVPPQTVSLTKMNLERTVSASGVIQSSDTRYITPKGSGGTVTRINYAVGDKVTNGATVVELDTEEIERSIKNTKSSLSSAERRNKSDLADANEKIKQAEAAQKANKTKSDADVSTALSALNAAKSAEDSRTHNDTVRVQIVIDKRATLTTLENDPGASAESIAAARADYDRTYKAEYDKIYNSNNYKPEQDAYNKAISERTTQSNKDAQEVKSAKSAYNALKNPDNIRNLKEQLENQNAQLANTKLKSPINGTITAVNVTVGGPATGSVMTIEDLSTLEVTASVPEYDVGVLQKDQEVEIKSDAYEQGVWQGKITSISPVAENGNFTVKVLITGSTENLKGGMSAKISVITERKTDIFAVPYSSIIKNAQGQDIIYVYEPAQEGEETPAQNRGAAGTGAQREIVVQTGLESDYFVEIISPDLTEGMQVLADPLNNSAGTPGGGPVTITRPGGGAVR